MMLNRPMVGDHPAAGLNRHAAIDQIGRQMHGDEGELKSAGKEAEHQQHIRAMTERLGQRMLECLLLRHGDGVLGRRPALPAPATAAPPAASTRQIPSGRSASRNCRAWRRRTARTRIARTTRRGARAQRDAAPFRRQQLAERRQHQIERTAGQAEADQNAGAEIERQRRRRIAHGDQAGGIHQRADGDHAQGAEAVGDRARQSAGPCPTADSGSPARDRTRRGPRRTPGSSAA